MLGLFDVPELDQKQTPVARVAEKQRSKNQVRVHGARKSPGFFKVEALGVVLLFAYLVAIYLACSGKAFGEVFYSWMVVMFYAAFSTRISTRRPAAAAMFTRASNVTFRNY